jgi:hypothetical protein
MHTQLLNLGFIKTDGVYVNNELNITVRIGTVYEVLTPVGWVEMSLNELEEYMMEGAV